MYSRISAVIKQKTAKSKWLRQSGGQCSSHTDPWLCVLTSRWVCPFDIYTIYEFAAKNKQGV